MRLWCGCFKVQPRHSQNHDDFEGTELIARRMAILLPTDKFRAGWDWIMIVLVLYSCFMYDVPLVLFVFNLFVDTFFIVDIVMNFRTAIYEQKMLSPVLDSKAIARSYVFGSAGWGGWFWPDMIAAIPFSWFPLERSETGPRSSALSFAKLGRMFRLARLIKKLDQFTAAHVVRVANFLVVLLLCTHCMACAWWSVGWGTEQDRGWQFEPKVASVLLEADVLYSDDPLLISFSAHGDVVANSTRLREILHDVPMRKKYITSLYWALTMVMKSPWLSPSIAGEQVYASITVVVGAMLFAAFIGNFTTAIASYDKSNAIYRDTISLLRGFFKMRPSLSPQMRRKIFRYADAYFKQTIEGVEELHVIKSVPEHIRPVLLLELHGDLVKSCMWMQEASFGCCTDFLLALQPEVLLAGDILLRAGVVSKLFYVLVSGELQVSFPPEGARASKVALVLGEGKASMNKFTSMQRTSSRVPQGRVERMGSLIGWAAPYAPPRPLTYSVRAGRDSSLLSISRSDLVELLDKHPQDASTFKRAVEHANKLINPVKRGMQSNNANTHGLTHTGRIGETSAASCVGEDQGLRTDRRCSTTEMSQMMQRDGSCSSLSAEVSAMKRRSSSGKRESTSSESKDDVDLERLLQEAVEGGWARGRESIAALTKSNLDRRNSYTGLESCNKLSVEGSLAILLEEVASLKAQVQALQPGRATSDHGSDSRKHGIW